MSNICPTCEKDDAIQKLSVIVASGQASGTFSGPSGGVAYVDGKWGTVGGYTTLSGSTTSELARLLVPPPEPRKPRGIGRWWILVLLLGVPYSLLFVAMSLTGATLSGGVNSPSFGSTLFCSLLAGPGLILGAFLFNMQILSSRKETYAKVKPAWETVMQKWNRLYFCHRDGIVFDPETNQTCAPSVLRGFVYKP